MGCQLANILPTLIQDWQRLEGQPSTSGPPTIDNHGEEGAQPVADLPTMEEPILSQRLEFPDDVVDEALLSEVSRVFDEALLNPAVEVPDSQPAPALEDAANLDSSAMVDAIPENPQENSEVVNGPAPTPVEAVPPMTSNEQSLTGPNAEKVGGFQKCWNNFTSTISRSGSNMYSLW